MSSARSVNDALEGYVAGRTTAAQLVSVVAGAYYGEGGRGKRDGLQGIVEVIERAHPGVIELSSTNDRPGFVVRLAERPFPQQFEAELRAAVTTALIAGSTLPQASVEKPGLLRRIVTAIRSMFTA